LDLIHPRERRKFHTMKSFNPKTILIIRNSISLVTAGGGLLLVALALALKEHKAFVEEHRKVQEQEATIAQLKSEIEALAATVKTQAAQIQKVSDRLEPIKPVAQD
jgi:hypothetical protein